jgi:hypothetical protein
MGNNWLVFRSFDIAFSVDWCSKYKTEMSKLGETNPSYNLGRATIKALLGYKTPEQTSDLRSYWKWGTVKITISRSS